MANDEYSFAPLWSVKDPNEKTRSVFRQGKIGINMSHRKLDQKHSDTEVPGTSASNMTSHFPVRPRKNRKVQRTPTRTLLRGLVNFLCRKFSKVQNLTPFDIQTWIKSIDSYLDLKNLPYEKFFCKGSIVFLYMICRESIPLKITSKSEFKAAFLACAFVTYSYLTLYDCYPVKLFLEDKSPKLFSQRCLSIALSMSHKMMMISKDVQYYLEVLKDLKAEA